MSALFTPTEMQDAIKVARDARDREQISARELMRRYLTFRPDAKDVLLLAGAINRVYGTLPK